MHMNGWGDCQCGMYFIVQKQKAAAVFFATCRAFYFDDDTIISYFSPRVCNPNSMWNDIFARQAERM